MRSLYRSLSWLVDHDPSYKILFPHRDPVADLTARVQGAELTNVNNLQQMRAMLAERVKTWTKEWKQQGLEQGIQQSIKEGLSRGEARLLRRH
jgi:hypothetical protein